MARQEIKLGAFWDVIFNAINANFGELYDAQGNAVTAAELTEQLAGYVTAGDLNAALNGYVSTTALAQQLANYITAAALTQQLSGYATTNALNEVAGNKVDKIAGKDLSTNDYTNDEKNKLAGLKAPAKHEFTATNWGTADSNGIYSMTISSTQHVANVFRADGSNFENAAVAISVNGGTITIKSEETFAGYVILV